MRVAYFTCGGASTSWQRRLYDEGADILVYNNPAVRDVGAGLVPQAATKDAWMQWGMQSSDTIWFVDETEQGELGDRLRATGKLVVSCGSFMDRLEMDREFGERIAAQVGIKTPPSKTFSTISDAIAFVKDDPEQQFGDGGWAWKPHADLGADATYVASDSQEMMFWLQYVALPKFGNNNRCLLQEKIKGVALSTARWWNGLDWTGPYEGTIENKKLSNGNKGPSTGCSLNIVWFYHEPTPRIARALAWDALTPIWRKYKAPPGLYDVNAIVNRQGAWFLEWTPRLGVDSELTSQRGIVNLAEMLSRVARGGDIDDLFDLDNVYCGVRLTIPPYPVELRDYKAHLDSPSKQVPIVGADGLWKGFFVGAGVARGPSGLVAADAIPMGFLGTAVAAASSVDEGFEAVYAYLDDKLRVSDLNYRTDAAETVQHDLDDMARAGWHTSAVLEEA